MDEARVVRSGRLRAADRAGRTAGARGREPAARRVLPAGCYAYCGSAYGPGGLQARIGRHLRADKALRWHVDRLTAAGRIVDFRAVPGGRECDLLDRLLEAPGASVPVPGFGSSDCRRCPAHLVALPEDGLDLGAAWR